MLHDTEPVVRLGNFSVQMRRSAAIDLSDADAVLLLLFSDEVKQAGISCVMLLSCLNAADFSHHLVLPSGIEAFTPQRSQPSFEAVNVSPLTLLLTPPVRAGFRGFSHFLAVSSDGFSQLLQDYADGSGDALAHAAIVQDALMSAACFATMVLRDLTAIHQRLFRDFDVAELSYLASLLDDVLQGQSPLFAGGELIKVKTDFTIRDVRVVLHADAIIADSDVVTRVVVRNISQGGLGIVGAGPLVVGRTVVIRLATTGRQLKGRIVWKVGEKAGVEFTERLSDQDRLLG